MIRKYLQKIYLALIFILLYAPIVTLIVLSFNQSKTRAKWGGFTLKWYKELLKNEQIMSAFYTTLIIAFVSAAIATVIGTAAAIAIQGMKQKWKTMYMGLTNIPMMNPDIITGISLMLMFVFVGSLLRFTESLNFFTMLIAHITFSLPYVILSVLPKFNQMDKSMPEAALDLGCTPLQSLFRVELPEIMPGVVTGGLMAFTMSLDDFVISYFTKGSSFQTLPLYIYGMTKKTVTPDMYALATIIFFVILILLIISNIISTKDERKQAKIRKSLNKT